jgi:hypothetical protein
MKERAAKATAGAASSSASVSAPQDVPTSASTEALAPSAPVVGPAGSGTRGAPGVHRTNTIEIETRLTPTARPRKDPRGGNPATKPKTSPSSKTVDVDPNPI